MVVPQKINNRVTMWSTTGTEPKELKAPTRRDICATLFIAALFTKTKRWKQPKCPSRDEWVKKNVVYTIHTGEYYLTLKRKEIQIHAATWMHLEDMMLSEISPSKKDRYCLIPLVWDSQSKSETESRMRLPGSGGKEEWGVCVNVYRVSVLQDKKVLETGYART